MRKREPLYDFYSMAPLQPNATLYCASSSYPDTRREWLFSLDRRRPGSIDRPRPAGWIRNTTVRVIFPCEISATCEDVELAGRAFNFAIAAAPNAGKKGEPKAKITATPVFRY